MACADLLHVRIDDLTYDQVAAVVAQFITDEASGPAEQDRLRERIHLARQFTEYGRGVFQEDAERQALLTWALETEAEWQLVLDADEVLEPGGGAALRELLLSPRAYQFRLLKVDLRYCSHHREGFIGGPSGIKPTCAFRLDGIARDWRFVADEDGLHPGRAPHPELQDALARELVVIHYHALTCQEWMGERAFYDGTGEVMRNGGIDWLFRCDRYHRTADEVPLEQALADAPARLARIAAGVGLTA